MKRPWIVTLVVATLAASIIGYIATLAVMALHGDQEALKHLNNAGLFALGALTSLLTKTSEAPEETKIINTPADPVQTKEAQ